MLLNRDPQTYWPLLGIKSKASFLLGPRKPGAGGNEALFKALQKLNNKDYRNVDQTTEKMFSYLSTGGNPKFGDLKIPENWPKHEAEILSVLPENFDELWVVSLASIEKGSSFASPLHTEGFNLSRMKLWCPYLSIEKIWREEMRRGNNWKFYIELVRKLEFSGAKSIQRALTQLEVASTERQTQHPINLLAVSVLLFVAACADADLDFAEGHSVFEWFLPQVEDGLIVPPLRRWMKYAKQILDVDTQQEATDILLGFQSEGASRDREGKKLWAFAGEYDSQKPRRKKLDLPSGDQFTKMAKAASKYVELNKPENVQYANNLKSCSAFVTFLSNLYDVLAELKSNKERIMLFNDYPYFYQIAQSTKGPPPRVPDGG